MLREECLNGEIFYSLKEVHFASERWWRQCTHGKNTHGAGLSAAGSRDHSAKPMRIEKNRIMQ